MRFVKRHTIFIKLNFDIFIMKILDFPCKEKDAIIFFQEHGILPTNTSVWVWIRLYETKLYLYK